jgi:hypothetical protein
MRKVFLPLVLFCCLHAYSQNCTVVPEALKGTYEGDCKKEKADGTGTAKGEDSYTGEFKNGYPDGKGKYTWKNGEWFEGLWKKGSREGQGTMHYTGKNSKDSVQTGFWKKDKYAGRYEKPYIVHSKTSDVVGLTVTKENDKDRDITFTMQSTSGGATGVGGSVIPKITITNMDIITGRYMTRTDDNNMPKTSKTVLRAVEFPLHIRIILETDIVELEFLEEGRYSVEIRINK